jgi:hypothetical protein
MMLVLRRDMPLGQCTLGVLTVGDRRFQTIERPWVDNTFGGKSGAKFVSCVAPGLYRVERFVRPSGEKAFILSNPELDVYRSDEEVEQCSKGTDLCRTRVLMHIANYVEDVVGCIGVGEERKYVAYKWMVTKSKQSMALLRSLIGSDLDLKLRIEQ